MRARLLTIGDELLIGQVVDTNAAWIGATLDEHGIRLVGKETVGDDPGDIIAALAEAALHADAVIVTGGLGPTPDDRTLESLAAHLGVGLELDEASWTRIQYIFAEIIRRPMSGDQRKQAVLPQGATALENRLGTAPGVWLEAGDKVYAATPGVPREMKALVTEQIIPRLLGRFSAKPAKRLTIQTAGMGETELSSAIADIAAVLPANVKLAYLPSLGTVRLRINVEGDDAAAVAEQLEVLRAGIVARIKPEAVVGYDDLDLVGAIREHLTARELTIGTAESCTGGRIAARLSARAGASTTFAGSIVAYDNAVKTRLLGVARQTLEAHGAVSEPVVTQMVRGAIAALGCDVAIATSGIAGPGGGTPDKPVGTIWVAAGSAERVVTRRLSLGNDRSTNIERTANAGLDLLRRFLVMG